MMTRSCCRRIVGENRSIESPFARLIATSFYDGPTDGLVECGTCGLVYAFRMLDWDDNQDQRIFSLASTGTSFQSIEKTSSIPPKWPSWILSIDLPQSTRNTINDACAAASRIEFVIATHSLLTAIDVWVPSGLPVVGDWFSELGLKRSE